MRISDWSSYVCSSDLSLRGSVVVLHAFQMLCPGCVSHGIPQAKAIHAAFPPDKVRVIGLHTVFEHHAAMGPVSLEAFVHEYRLSFPIAIDTPADDGPIPKTMQALPLKGHPTLDFTGNRKDAGEGKRGEKQ